MKRLVLRVMTVAVLVCGALAILFAAFFCFLGLPAFHSTVAGTTSLLLSQSAEEAQQLETYFVMAAMGVALLNFGILSVIQGAMGIHGLRTGRFGKFVFTSCVMAFSSLFELLSGIGDGPVSGVVIALNLVFAGLAYWEQRTREKDEAPASEADAGAAQPTGEAE